jgi:hypothetical protein
MVLGTPEYMAPEAATGKETDHRVDEYALGCILYEMLTGRLPFEAPTVMALLSKHLMETPPPPSQRRPDLGLPPMIDDLVMSALAKNPAQRPPTMEQLGETIHALLATLPPDPAGPSQPVSVPYVPTPPAYSAVHASPTAPAPFAPATPPPSTPAYTPHASPALPMPTPPPASAPVLPSTANRNNRNKKSNAGLFVVLGVVLLAGAGVGVYFVTRKDDKPADASPPIDDKWDPKRDDNTDDDPPDEPDEPDPPDPPDDDGSKPDPWGGAGAAPSGTSTAPTTSTAGLPGDTVDIGQGARFIVPPGFTVQRSDDGVMAVDVTRGILFGFAAVDADTDNARVLAQRYANTTGLRLKKVDQEYIQGAKRNYAVFDGNMGNVAVRHMVIAFLAPGYRIGMIIHFPQALGNDPKVQQLATEAASRRLLLPAASH